MPSMIKKPCLNSSEWTYTGKEVSPTGLGYAPDGETEGTQMKGRDETMWVVGRKNGVKVWNRIPTVLVKETPVINDKEEKEDDMNSDAEEPEPEPVPVPPPKTPAAPKKVKKDIVPKIDPKDVTINKNLIDRLNEVADPAVEEPAPVVEPTVPVVPEAQPGAQPEKKKRAPAKKKVEEPKAAEPAEPAVPEAQPEKKKRAPAKKKVEEAKPVEPVEEATPAEPEKKKRAPAKKKADDGEAKPQTDYQIFLVARLKTIDGATHKERFGAAAKEWGAMSKEQQTAAVAKLK